MWLVPGAGRCVILAAGICLGVGTVPRRALPASDAGDARWARPVLAFDRVSVSYEEDQPDAAVFMQELRKALDPVRKLETRWEAPQVGAPPEGGAAAVSVIQAVRTAYATEAEDRVYEDGGRYVRYSLAITVQVQDTGAGKVVMTRTSSCSADDVPVNPKDAYTYDPHGQLMGRSHAVATCLARAAKDLALEIANAFPLRGALVAGQDNALSVGLGIEDGMERGLRFDLLRPGLVSVEASSGMRIDKPPVKIGEIEVAAPGGASTPFKVRKIEKGETPQAGDLVIERPRAGKLLDIHTVIR